LLLVKKPEEILYPRGSSIAFRAQDPLATFRSRFGNHSSGFCLNQKKQAAHLDGLFRYLFQRSLLLFFSSGERSRTSTPVRTIDFESIASAIPPHRPVEHQSVATDQATDLVSIPT
jgi:hypothetical protein